MKQCGHNTLQKQTLKRLLTVLLLSIFAFVPSTADARQQAELDGTPIPDPI
ncbi:MAG: hypothetical protein AB8C95_13520 [Phycisphaeraceae bacterium]